MPIVYCRKLCPGKNGKKCKWSIEVQRRAAKIRDDADFCEICLACDSDWDLPQLSLQLSHLYSLDPDIFHAARRKMPPSVFDSVGPMVMAALVSSVPHSKNAREAKRRTYLTSTLSQLTQASWILDCWRRKVEEDTRDICNMEVAMQLTLPFTTRGLIIEFICGNLDALYGYICKMKSNTYHTLERPIFWHPMRDWVIPNDKSNARTMLIGVYSHILEYYHKPKIRRLKRSIVTHNQLIKKIQSLECRSKRCLRLLHILERMLELHVEIIVAPPF
jgi:hypothetical protein